MTQKKYTQGRRPSRKRPGSTTKIPARRKNQQRRNPGTPFPRHYAAIQRDESFPIDDIIARIPKIAALDEDVHRRARNCRRQIAGPRDFISFVDAAVAQRLLREELYFDAGFERGRLAGRAESREVDIRTKPIVRDFWRAVDVAALTANLPPQTIAAVFFSDVPLDSPRPQGQGTAGDARGATPGSATMRSLNGQATRRHAIRHHRPRLAALRSRPLATARRSQGQLNLRIPKHGRGTDLKNAAGTNESFQRNRASGLHLLPVTSGEPLRNHVFLRPPATDPLVPEVHSETPEERFEVDLSHGEQSATITDGPPYEPTSSFTTSRIAVSLRPEALLMMSARSLLATVVFGAVLLVVPSPLRADPRPEARQAAEQAKRDYNLGHWQDAIQGFERAYQLSGDPAFLFNLAQCHRRADHIPEALSLYRSYLRERPNAPDRDIAEMQIHELERRSPAVSPSALVGASEPTVPPALPPQTSLALAPHSTDQGTPSAYEAAPPPPAEHTGPPLPRWVPWAGIGATAALAASAVALGISANHRYDTLLATCGQTPEGCTPNEIDTVRSRELATTGAWVLTGVVAAASGITIVVNTREAGLHGLWRF